MSVRVAILIPGVARTVIEVEPEALGAMDDATGAAMLAARLRKEPCVRRVKQAGFRVLAEVERVPF